MRNLKRLLNIFCSLAIIVTFSSYGLLNAVIIPTTVTSSTDKTFNVPIIIDGHIKIYQPSSASPMLGPFSVNSVDEFLTLTPSKYRELTGKRLGIKKSIELKLAQKMVKKQSKAEGGGGDLPKWLYIVMSIFFLGWLAIGIKGGFKGNDWWICLLLYFLFWLPGVIYALVVMDKYY